MLTKSTAIRLMMLGALMMMAGRAAGQAAHTGVHYQVPHPTYENGSAPFAEDQPGPTHDWSPFKPVGFEPRFDWFAPAETSGYGKGPHPRVGYFFSMERVYWSLSKPERSIVGSENAEGTGLSFPSEYNPLTGDPFLIQGIPTIFTNTVDTGKLLANGAWGNRWELGYMDVDDYGWLVSVLDHVSQSQYHTDRNVIMQFSDPGNLLEGSDFSAVVFDFFPDLTMHIVTAGKIPVRFDVMHLQNITRLNGVEVMRMYRARQLHSSAWFELLYGVRWLQMQDTFIVQGQNSWNSTILPPQTPSQTNAVVGWFNPLADSLWSTRVQNNMVGPQIGFRLWRQRERWITSVEARFLAAANFQNMHQRTNLGSNVLPNTALQNLAGFWEPVFFQGIGANNSQFATTFSPVGEIRVNASYQVTRSVGVKVGYTGLVAGNVARASSKVDYDSPDLIGLRSGAGTQIFFANGINFGVEINR